MATTQRDIYYTDAGNDADTADLNVITKRIADSVEAALDVQEAYLAMPVGAVSGYAGAVAPPGWALCDGTAVSRSTYAGLFSAIGTTHGVGNGTTTFNLPDLRSRFVVGSGQGSGTDTQGNALNNRGVGVKGGAETHKLLVTEMPEHNHGGVTNNAGQHDHGGGYRVDGQWRMLEAGSEFNTAQSVANPLIPQGDHTHIIGAQGGGAAHNNMPPFYALAFIIKTT